MLLLLSFLHSYEFYYNFINAIYLKVSSPRKKESIFLPQQQQHKNWVIETITHSSYALSLWDLVSRLGRATVLITPMAFRAFCFSSSRAPLCWWRCIQPCTSSPRCTAWCRQDCARLERRDPTCANRARPRRGYLRYSPRAT